MDGFVGLRGLRLVLEDGFDLAIEAGVYAGLLALVVLAINIVFRRWLSASQMGVLWGLVLLRLVVPIVPDSGLSLESAFVTNETETSSASVGAVPYPAPVVQLEKYDPVADLTDANLAQPASAAPAHWLDEVASLVPLVWAVVGAGGLAWTVARYARFNGQVRRSPDCDDERVLRLWARCCKLAGVRSANRIVFFQGIDQPAIMGVFHPTLLLPCDAEELTDDQLRMVMLHELAHVQRWDIAANWALVAIRSIHWWNPVCWLAAARYRTLREQACDAYVVRRLEVASRASYGELLLTLAKRPAAAWRVTLPASILSFFPLLFRRLAIRVRLTALRTATVRRGRIHGAAVVGVVLLLAISGFTTATTKAPEPVDLADWMAKNPDAVLARQRSYEVQEVYGGPQVTRDYDIAAAIDKIVENGVALGNTVVSNDDAQRMLKSTLDHLYFRDSKADGAAAPSPPTCAIEGLRLSVTAPVALHEKLRRTLDAWSESGLAQIVVETRFVTADRDLASDLGISWEFMEAFSPERENVLQSAGDKRLVVRAEARVDEYLPLVVANLNRDQFKRLIDTAQRDPRSNVLSSPKVTIFNGQEALIADCVESPFVVGVFERVAGLLEPKVVVIEEGTRIRMRARQKHDPERVQINASLDMRALGDVTTASTSFQGQQVTIQVPSVNRRSLHIAAELDEEESLLVGFIPTDKQREFSYFVLSARRIE